MSLASALESLRRTMAARTPEDEERRLQFERELDVTLRRKPRHVGNGPSATERRAAKEAQKRREPYRG